MRTRAFSQCVCVWGGGGGGETERVVRWGRQLAVQNVQVQ